jgi:nitric oxide reductase subunit C
MKLRSFMILSALSLGGFAFLNWQSVQLPFPMPEEATQGKQVWQAHNCISCHTVFGNGGYNGDDLTHIVSKRSSKELMNFFLKPPVMRPNHQRLHPKVSEAEAENLVQYFILIDKIPTLGWPPKPHKPGEST